MKITAKLWIGIAALIILSPLGLILPQSYKAGSAWGEWGIEELQGLIGYIPKGLAKISTLWSAPIADYSFQGHTGKGLLQLSISYMVSAILGVILIVAAVLIIGRILSKKGD